MLVLLSSEECDKLDRKDGAKNKKQKPESLARQHSTFWGVMVEKVRRSQAGTDTDTACNTMDVWRRGNTTKGHSQLSISSVQFCSSSGYLRRSIMQAAVVVILEPHTHKKSSDGAQFQARRHDFGTSLQTFKMAQASCSTKNPPHVLKSDFSDATDHRRETYPHASRFIISFHHPHYEEVKWWRKGNYTSTGWEQRYSRNNPLIFAVLRLYRCRWEHVPRIVWMRPLNLQGYQLMQNANSFTPPQADVVSLEGFCSGDTDGGNSTADYGARANPAVPLLALFG